MSLSTQLLVPLGSPLPPSRPCFSHIWSVVPCLIDWLLLTGCSLERIGNASYLYPEIRGAPALPMAAHELLQRRPPVLSLEREAGSLSPFLK